MISIFKITYFQQWSEKMHRLILTFFGMSFYPLTCVNDMQEIKILHADAAQ